MGFDNDYEKWQHIIQCHTRLNSSRVRSVNTIILLWRFRKWNNKSVTRTNLDIVNFRRDAITGMLLLFVKMISVMFLNVRKDTQKFESIIGTREDVNLQLVVNLNMRINTKYLKKLKGNWKSWKQPVWALIMMTLLRKWRKSLKV